MSTFTTRANFSIFSFWAANSVFSICTTLSFCCARSAKFALTARPAQPDRPPVVLFPFPAWPPAQASRVLSGFDDGRTLDLPSAPATASAHGYALSPRGYEPRPVHGLFASQMLGQPACPRNEAPAVLPTTSPAAIAGHHATHCELHTSAAHSHASPVSRVNRAPSHSSPQSRPHDLAAQQALCDHSTKYSQLASGHSASPHAALPQRTSAGYSHRIESSPKRH